MELEVPSFEVETWDPKRPGRVRRRFLRPGAGSAVDPSRDE